MSLKFVTKKLEGHSLDEELNNRKEKVVEDSGTESDDETEPELVDGDADSDNVDSGISLNLRSAAKVGGRSRQLPPLMKDPVGMVEVPEAGGGPEDNDNHSSEEELEDIIGDKRKVYVSEPSVTSSSVKMAGRASAVEKRKWSEVDQTNHGNRTGSGSSGDEEVRGYMGCSYTPVQFCTSPPLNVYKPRRSQSPPPKLFHLSTNGNHSGPQHFNSLRETQMLSGAFRPRAGRGDSLLDAGGLGSKEDGDGDEDRSPSKKHRTTPRPHNIQRPCLDFEKMQQIKTKVVTSWRQGAELSLFCW